MYLAPPLTLLAVLAVPVFTQAADERLAADAHALLKARCYNCHGLTEQVSGMQILERDVLVSGPTSGGLPWLTPGDPDASRIWKQVAAGYMPLVDEEDPHDKPLTEAEKSLLKRWIVEGAPFPSQVARREFVSNRQVLEGIRDYLNQKVQPENVKFQRFFSLAHLHNDAAVGELQLQLTRAALSKVLNSVTREKDVVLPVAVDAQETVFAIDLREFGWTDTVGGKLSASGDWRSVVQAYPYGLRPQDQDELNVFNQISRLYDRGFDFDGLPFLRADWFVAQASRPPLYHTLAGIPETLAELEKQVGVNRDSNFRNGRLIRGVVQQSGVSAQNRLLERHSSSQGRYWISFDFKSNAGRGNLVRFPLGPKFEGNPFNDDFAFEHDGGEVIFERANGMDGYMLIDGKGNRIDSGPIEIVRDLKETSGTPLIVNGISCMACHKQGIVDFTDTVRESDAVFVEDAKTKVRELYPDPQDTNAKLQRDRRDYVQTLRDVIGPFLPTTGYEARQPEDFPEPVREVARHYAKDLRFEDVAYELGLEQGRHENLRGRMDTTAVKLLGIGPVLNGHTLKRAMWDSKAESGGTSVFQLVAQKANIGVPVSAPQ